MRPNSLLQPELVSNAFMYLAMLYAGIATLI